MTTSSDSGDEEPSDDRPRSEPQFPPSSDSELESGGSASKSDIATRRSRMPRGRRRYRDAGGYTVQERFQRVTMALEASKADILQLLESQHPLDLASFSTVNASGILASVITSLVHGDCDLPLPLGPENSYLSSMFTTSAYDLDLADEELDSIISVTETQQRVIRAFKMQSPQRQPTQNAWYWELDPVFRMLEDNVGVYKDLKVQIDKLKRQVTLQVELKQDNNSKAILVFTIVTVIFLPLSFMTSYFGMNARDIRDMATGQWIFWAISVPLTTSVVAFCMTIAYQGRKIQEYFHRL
ncbi:CorA-like Mg2+ transporter protein [Aspergillus sp. HF37]|nr:CorA-like Mg2+ transporter protein [Aspergillus sp. HF37]